MKKTHITVLSCFFALSLMLGTGGFVSALTVPDRDVGAVVLIDGVLYREEDVREAAWRRESRLHSLAQNFEVAFRPALDNYISWLGNHWNDPELGSSSDHAALLERIAAIQREYTRGVTSLDANMGDVLAQCAVGTGNIHHRSAEGSRADFFTPVQAVSIDGANYNLIAVRIIREKMRETSKAEWQVLEQELQGIIWNNYSIQRDNAEKFGDWYWKWYNFFFKGIGAITGGWEKKVQKQFASIMSEGIDMEAAPLQITDAKNRADVLLSGFSAVINLTSFPAGKEAQKITYDDILSAFPVETALARIGVAFGMDTSGWQDKSYNRISEGIGLSLNTGFLIWDVVVLVGKFNPVVCVITTAFQGFDFIGYMVTRGGKREKMIQSIYADLLERRDTLNDCLRYEHQAVFARA